MSVLARSGFAKRTFRARSVASSRATGFVAGTAAVFGDAVASVEKTLARFPAGALDAPPPQAERRRRRGRTAERRMGRRSTSSRRVGDRMET
jgi:hypothetical protein